MMAALALVRRVSSTANVVALGHSEDRVKDFTRGNIGEHFLSVSQQSPPGCVSIHLPGFRGNVQYGRGVGRVVIIHISPVAEKVC